MSMFYELMMRKKEEIMYATIKGSLTESPEGVFSGFSASNYLKLQQQFQPADKNWEIVIKTEITQLNVTQTIIGSSTNSNNIQLAIRDTNIIRFYRTTNGTSDAISNSSLTIDSLGVYYFKISFNGSQYKVSVSQDGNNYIDYIVTTSSTPIYNNSPRLALGVNGRQMNTEYFRGSIDLNRSYIKIDNTKYKLQAVVGYTIVGSPTITDGVASGFSDSNYLTIQQYLPDNFEMFITFTTPNSWTNEYEDIFNYRQLFNIEKHSTNISTYNWTTNSYKYIVPNVKTNTKYSVKIIKEGTSISFWYKEENNDFVLSGSLTTTKTAVGYSCFGINQATSGRFFTGFINLNETYIKSNNKLWFNGQQA